MCPTDFSQRRAAACARDDEDEPERPRDAAQWFARMQSGEVTPAERRAFAAWLEADDDHRRQYRNLDYLWDASLALSERRLRALAQDARAPRQRVSMPRRRLGLGLAFACSAAVAAGMVGRSGWFGRGAHALEFSTGKGERTQTTLADGSVMNLNADTRLAVHLGERRRLVELRQGEAFFDVRPDAARPFVVEAGVGRVVVKGTRFNVRRDAEAVQVSVEEGSVSVRTGHGRAGGARRWLKTGEQATAYADRTLSEVQNVNVSNVVAWQRGKLVFNDVPLASVIEEMNRYLARPARLDALKVGRHRVSAVLSVDDPEAMIAALPAIAPVRVQRLADGTLSVGAR